MKRIIYIIAVITAVCALLGGVSVAASYEEENLTRVSTFIGYTEENADVEPPHNDENAPLGESADGTLVPDAEDNEGEKVDGTPVPDAEDNEGEKVDVTTEENGENDTQGPTNATESDKADNPFATAFSAVKGYATEILAALTFIGSLILAYAYKRGLIPLLKSSISAISGTVAKVKESAERGEGKTDELAISVTSRLNDAELILDGITETLSTLESTLDGIKSDKDEVARLKVIMSAQVDMLYAIFISSALPQYQKDEVGRRIAEMREALSCDEGE